MRHALLGLLVLAGCVKNAYSGREQLIWIDEPSELQLGIQGYQEALAASAISTSPAEVDPVVRVGKRLSAVANKPAYKWEFRAIVDDETLTAWCMPGGKIAFSTGLFPVMEDEAGVAFVMGHEISHALLRHGAERLCKAFASEAIGAITAATIGGNDPQKQRTVLGCYGVVAQGGLLMPFLPEHEAEADRLGLELMARAGYDPRQAIEAWKRMERQAGGGTPEFLSVHPSHMTRIKDLESRLPTALALYDQAIKAPVARLPKVGGRKGKGVAALTAPAGTIVGNAASYLRTKTKENRHALLLEFWINEDVYLEGVRVAGADGLTVPIDAKVGIPANLKKQVVLVRPDTGSADFPGGRYTLALTGSASGRSFSASCAFEVR
ncbi:MAG TPA: M48 family metallopeptidase [Planctomycetota bacterium]|nr:M48 family metallopeptidase [Planctomycetota bacterium]